MKIKVEGQWAGGRTSDEPKIIDLKEGSIHFYSFARSLDITGVRITVIEDEEPQATPPRDRGMIPSLSTE
jgi:hypothetical protein